MTPGDQRVVEDEHNRVREAIKSKRATRKLKANDPTPAAT